MQGATVGPPHDSFLCAEPAPATAGKTRSVLIWRHKKRTNISPSWVGFFCRSVLERNQTRHPKAACSISQLRGGRVAALTDSSIIPPSR